MHRLEQRTAPHFFQCAQPDHGATSEHEAQRERQCHTSDCELAQRHKDRRACARGEGVALAADGEVPATHDISNQPAKADGDTSRAHDERVESAAHGAVGGDNGDRGERKCVKRVYLATT